METPTELKDGEKILSISLRRDWTTTPSYWFELWEQTRGKIRFWFIRRAWNFYKGKGADRELVEGYSVSTRFTAITTILMAMEEGIEQKVKEKGFLICEKEIPFASANEVLKEFLDKYPVVATPVKEKKKYQALQEMRKGEAQAQLSEAVKKRKRKGYWS